MELDLLIGARCGQKVSPFENFGKTEVMKGMNDCGDGFAGTDDENFDGFAVLPGVAVELQRKFDANGVWSIGGVYTEGLRLHCHLSTIRTFRES